MIIKNVQIINYNQVIKNGNIHIKNGKIEKIEKISGVGKNIVIPGFINIHIHGIKNFDVMDGIKSIDNISKYLLNNGTTSFAPTLMTAPFTKILKAFNAINLVNNEFANIIGFHLEGPFISKAKKGAHDPKLLLEPTLDKMQKLIEASNQRLRKIVIAPEVCDLKVVKFLIKNNIIVAMGHSNAHGDQIDKFIKAGARSATHLWNGMSSIENRNPGLAQKVLLSNQVKAELICDLAHVDPETIKLTTKIKSIKDILVITDAIKPAKTKFKESVSGGLKIVKDGKYIKLKQGGSIAGGNTTMYDNFMNLYKLGYSLNDIVAMTSYNQAQEFKLNKGEIKKGKDADLLVLDSKLKIASVVIRGEKWK